MRVQFIKRQVACRVDRVAYNRCMPAIVLATINARYVHEFENSNRPEGDLFQFSANLKF